jgi:predicted nucleic acid-binding protein
MRIYLDTSSLIKLYHTESGTEELDGIFESNQVQEVFVSSLTKVEFNSALWKKVRTKDLIEIEAVEIMASFEADYSNYSFIEVTQEVLLVAKELISKYGLNGLRTLDSIQLASILKVKSKLDLAITADDLLNSLIEMEGIKNTSKP